MNNQTRFLTLYNNYQTTICALFSGTTLLDSIEMPNKTASSKLIPSVDTLLKNQNTDLSACSFVAAHRGPAPFTTLRVIISTANGLAFATKQPLIGINGMHVFIDQERDATCDFTLALFNAFGHDVYYGLYNSRTQELIIGCMAIDALCNYCENHITAFYDQYGYKPQIKLAGNAITAYTLPLLEKLQARYIVPDPIPVTISGQILGKHAWNLWQSDETTNQLLPLYLKQRSTPIRTQIS
jgi:tRNA threonylcarbamoyladenosine biosynthesis protein TsaB